MTTENQISEPTVDEILEGIESEGPDTGWPETQENPQPVEQQAQPTEAPADPEDEIVWGGEKVKLPLSKIKMYAQQGYDYTQKMTQFKTERETLLREKTDLEQKLAALDEYRQVQDWAKANQGEWEAARAKFRETAGAAAQNLGGVDLESHPFVKGILSKVETLEKTLQSTTQSKEDQALDQEIEKFKAEHSYFDWKEQDIDGKTLEKRIYDHAIEKGIGSFEAAGLHLLYPKILEKRTSQAKEKAAKEIQRTNRLGITPLKSKVTPKARPVRESTYEDLAQEALAEYGFDS